MQELSLFDILINLSIIASLKIYTLRHLWNRDGDHVLVGSFFERNEPISIVLRNIQTKG